MATLKSRLELIKVIESGTIG